MIDMSLRYGLAKYLKNEMSVDISDDSDFATSREVYLTKCMKLKKCVLGSTEHYPSICEEIYKNCMVETIMPLT